MCTYTDIWYNHKTVLRCRLHIMFLETEKIVHLHSKSLFKVVLLDMKESKKLILSYNSKQCALASQIRCPFFSDFRVLWDSNYFETIVVSMFRSIYTWLVLWLPMHLAPPIGHDGSLRVRQHAPPVLFVPKLCGEAIKNLIIVLWRCHNACNSVVLTIHKL